MWIIDRIARAWEDGKVRPGALTHPDGCGGPYYEDPPGPPPGADFVVGIDYGTEDGPLAMVAARPRPDGTIDVWPYTGPRDAAALAERLRAGGVHATMFTPADPWSRPTWAPVPPRVSGRCRREADGSYTVLEEGPTGCRPDASADAVVDRLNGRWPA